jgi:hypothetical protein
MSDIPDEFLVVDLPGMVIAIGTNDFTDQPEATAQEMRRLAAAIARASMGIADGIPDDVDVFISWCEHLVGDPVGMENLRSMQRMAKRGNN